MIMHSSTGSTSLDVAVVSMGVVDGLPQHVQLDMQL